MNLKRTMVLTLFLIGIALMLSGCVNMVREPYTAPGSGYRWHEPGFMYPEQSDQMPYDRTTYPGLTTEFSSNGEMIYYTGFNESGRQIPIRGGPHWLYMHGGSCVGCHGVNGMGGVPIMMSASIPSDIRYEALISEDEHADEHEDHPPYTDESIKIAIRQGKNPSGEELDYTMPRWDMSDSDIEDIIGYLKTL
ncbi:cytochrome c [Methanolobus sp. ZRKC3]|uniref:c-type cytochrome n=1 Tax=Methanolobus sp. ZRKC3 TaxID=3125786 RepID=UPI003255C7B7